MKTIFLFILLAIAEQWVIQLDRSADPAHFASQHNLIYEKPMKNLNLVTAANEGLFYSFRAAATSKKRHSTRQLRSAPNVKWVERQVAKRQFKRAVSTVPPAAVPDPLYTSQWHLHMHPYSIEANREANVTGKGVTITIVDDGFQWRHPELQANYNHENSWDFNGNKADPSPTNGDDGHGTAAAGMAAGVANNGHCGRGSAPEATVSGIRLIAAPADDATESEALSYNAIGAVDIFSCSWGPQDDGKTFGPMGFLTQRTLGLYTNGLHGRMGKGSIYVWASGNGRGEGDTCGFDGYANSPFVIPVGAIDHLGKASWYSEGCAALMAVAPSSGESKGVITADLMGPAGYSEDECTATFGGTSAAAPLAAGIVALILQERPDLTWRDVKDVIAKGSSMIQPHDADWHYNGRHYHHSHQYGFGLLRVPPLMAAARAHVLLPAVKMLTLPTAGFPNSDGIIPINHTFVVSASQMKFVEHVSVHIYLLHPERGRVTVKLVSPSGTVSRLAESRSHDVYANYPPAGWIFNSVRHWGEEAVDGNWLVVVEDVKKDDPNVGTVTQIQLSISGH